MEGGLEYEGSVNGDTIEGSEKGNPNAERIVARRIVAQ
jgi:hypothetical protein